MGATRVSAPPTTRKTPSSPSRAAPSRPKHDPERLQSFRIRSCVKDKGLERKRDSTSMDFALRAAVPSIGNFGLGFGLRSDGAPHATPGRKTSPATRPKQGLAN